MFDENILVRRLFGCCALIAAVLLAGTFGYVYLERWNVADSFYMSVITLSTVGYGETRELSPTGRLFTSGLIFISVIGLSIWTASLTSLLVEGDLSGKFLNRKAKRMSASFNNHTIVCGSDMMAQAVIQRLSQKGIPIVVVDDASDSLTHLRKRFPQVPVIETSAIDELSLADANVLAAKNLVAALPDDFDNLLVAMTCKDLGTEIQVVARAHDQRIASRMLKAGVDNVICPFQICGEQAASLVNA